MNLGWLEGTIIDGKITGCYASQKVKMNPIAKLCEPSLTVMIDDGGRMASEDFIAKSYGAKKKNDTCQFTLQVTKY